VNEGLGWPRGVYWPQFAVPRRDRVWANGLPDSSSRTWRTVVLASDGWLIDGVYLPRDPTAGVLLLCHRMPMDEDRLQLAVALDAGAAAALLADAEREWLAAVLGGYLPPPGPNGRFHRTAPR
jgi:hypothetical protein